MTLKFPIPVIGLCAHSGSGKTTLLKKLVSECRAQGMRCSAIKKSHHDFEIDIPGKDSYEIRHAGVSQMLLASPYRQALISEMPTHAEPGLAALLQQLNCDGIDLVFVEGFRDEPFDKIEICRSSLQPAQFYLHDPHIIAVASDTPLPLQRVLPRLDLNDASAVFAFILQHFKLRPRL